MTIFYNKLSELTKPKENNDVFAMLQSQIQDLGRQFEQKIGETHKTMNENQTSMHSAIQNQFGQSAKIISDVTEKLTKLDETNRQVMNFAVQLQGLEDILQNPKQRGILGEYYLENVLLNVLPPGSFQMQYKFSDGDIVDAVVFVKDKVIPKEGTMDFAFMFIPSEGIYYDLLINQVGSLKTNTHDLIEYAFKEKHVIIVSPTSFLAYLQTVLQGLRALQIEESAK